ncbi:hypothetical protein GCM10010911_09340 [Paenibacillus nasutitermitis]|uniref:Uncharacterized protein n=1 Tax=Paenibacillus nasutitermitis TaxID=1652958 RepID=A0A916YP14_9BACL|nr:hypothetical protein GCM10010911_09340 [Paenibacillus nasutitermitis]
MQGIELSRRFYAEMVEPIMKSFPNTEYSAALIGPGSEVLGYDTDMSRDHDFSPRVFLFLEETDTVLTGQIQARLAQQAPPLSVTTGLNLSSLRDDSFLL